jgi:hypothetical protein
MGHGAFANGENGVQETTTQTLKFTSLSFENHFSYNKQWQRAKGRRVANTDEEIRALASVS